jgi:HEAT repeat protein
MVVTRRHAWLALCICTGATLPVRADPAAPRVELGPAAVATVEAGKLRVIENGAPALEVTIDRGAPTLEAVRIGGQPMAHLRVELGHTRREIVVTSPAKVIFDGLTGPLPDGEGERQLEISEREMVYFQRAADHVRCDGYDRLFARRFDPTSGWQPRPSLPAVTSTLRAVGSISGISGKPGTVLQFRDASIDAGAAGGLRADHLTAPTELSDGDPKTTWSAGAGQQAAGQWVTARSTIPAAGLRALRIVPAPGALPSEAILVIATSKGEKQAFGITLGRGPSWFEPKLPDAACVSLVIAKPASGDNALSEVELYTNLDGPSGLDLLIDLAAAGISDARGELEKRGSVAARAVEARLARATGDERSALLSVLAAMPSDPASAPVLGRALERASAKERAMLIRGLVARGEAGQHEAARIVSDRSQTDEAVADALEILTRGPDQTLAIEALLGRLATLTPPLRALLVRVLAALPPAERDTRAAQLVATYDQASDFVLRATVLEALGAVRSKRATPLLEKLASDPDDALRVLALTAGLALPDAEAEGFARRALADHSPAARERAAAWYATRPSPASTDALLVRLLRDSWPRVREAAAFALGTRCDARRADIPRALTQVIGVPQKRPEPSESVRRAALRALDACGGEDRFATLAQVATDSHDSPTLRALAILLLSDRKSAGLERPIQRALDEALGGANQDERLVTLAIAALRALERVGAANDATLESLGAAARDPVWPQIRAAAIDTVGALCPENAGKLLREKQSDPEPAVLRAVERAKARCKR